MNDCFKNCCEEGTWWLLITTVTTFFPGAIEHAMQDNLENCVWISSGHD
jgi:hypothetical protein